MLSARPTLQGIRRPDVIGGTRVPVSAPPEEEVALPASAFRAVRLEFGRALRAPYVLPSVVVVNGLLMTGLWYWAPGAWKNSPFSPSTGRWPSPWSSAAG